MLKAVKPAVAIAHSGWMQLVSIFDFAHTHFPAGDKGRENDQPASLEEEKPSSCHSPFGLVQLVNIFDFGHTHFPAGDKGREND